MLYKYIPMSLSILGKHKLKKLHSTYFCIYRENCPKTTLIFKILKTDPVLMQPIFKLKETGKHKKVNVICQIIILAMER